jgi:HEAT repeat protein
MPDMLIWIWTATVSLFLTGLGLTACAALTVLVERWRAPVRASRDAFRTAALLDHVAAGTALPEMRSRRSARAWARTARQLAELISGTEGEALRRLADRMDAVSPSRRIPVQPVLPAGEAWHAARVEDLDRMARSDRRSDRRQALDVLVSRGHPDATKTFIRALRDVDPHCRSLALAGLADLRVVAASDHMTELLDDPSWRVRETARLALGKLAEDPARAETSGVIQWI